MLRDYPTRNRILVRVSLTSAWVLAGGAGFTSALLLNVVRELGTVMTVVCGVILTIGALVATLGVALDRYRWEWSAAWFAAFGLSPYFVAIWAAVFLVDLGRISQAFLVTALVTFFLYRAMMCSAHAARLRGLHHEAEVTLHAGDNGDDGSARSE